MIQITSKYLKNMMFCMLSTCTAVFHFPLTQSHAKQSKRMYWKVLFAPFVKDLM